MHLREFLLSITAIMTMAPGISSAETTSPADQLAMRFTSFCLGHRLTQADQSRRAARIGAVQERVMSSDGELMLVWRGSSSHNHFRYSFDTNTLPHGHVRIVGCSVGGHDVSVAGVIAALQQPSRLGKSNDDNAPSLIARNAGWFFVKNREPNWVSASEFSFGGDQIVVVGISTHPRLRP